MDPQLRTGPPVSLIIEVDGSAPPTSLTVLALIEEELSALAWLEGDIGRPTSFTRGRRRELERRHAIVREFVN